MVGGGILAAGPFLPWVQAGLLSADGVQKTGGEAYILVGLGLVALLVAGLALGTSSGAAKVGLFIIGIISTAASGYYLFTIQEHIEVGRQSAAEIERHVSLVTSARTNRYLASIVAVLAARRT